MHYYKRNIGDYAKKAGRLSILQHGIYTLLIDACYDREDFPSLEEAIDWTWAASVEEIEAVEFVLRKFFTLNDDGKYVQNRISEEIDEYHEICRANAENGRKGGRPKGSKNKQQKTHSVSKKTHSVSEESEGNPSESEKKPKPLTTNHKPLKELKTLSGEPDPPTVVFNYWVEVMGKNPDQVKLTPKRLKAVQARLKQGYTVDLIKTAIRHCRGDPWSMGQNDRHKEFNDLELICRTGEKLESFIELHPNGGNHAQNRPGGNPAAPKLTPAQRTEAKRQEALRRDTAGQSSVVGVVEAHGGDVRPYLGKSAG